MSVNRLFRDSQAEATLDRLNVVGSSAKSLLASAASAQKLIQNSRRLRFVCCTSSRIRLVFSSSNFVSIKVFVRKNRNKKGRGGRVLRVKFGSHRSCRMAIAFIISIEKVFQRLRPTCVFFVCVFVFGLAFIIRLGLKFQLALLVVPHCCVSPCTGIMIRKRELQKAG